MRCTILTATLVLLALGVVLAPCARAQEDKATAFVNLLQKLVGQPPDRIALDDELQYGETIMALMIHSYGGRLLDEGSDAAIWDYVNTLAAAIAPASLRPDLPAWHVGVVVNDEVGACSGPGGYILLTTGLLRAVANEAELAGVIAHEMAHICRRHGLHGIWVELRQGSVFSFLGASSKGGGALVGKVRQAFGRGTEYKYGREKEFEADQLGAQWAYRTGYDPRALAAFITRLPHDESRAYRNHPANDERVARLAKVTAELKGCETLPNLRDRYARVVHARLGAVKLIPKAPGTEQTKPQPRRRRGGFGGFLKNVIKTKDGE